jgi:Xaa-Pro aminopeptidase
MDFTPFKMENRYDSIVAITREELERRWELMRSVMRENDLTLAVLVSYRSGEKRGIHQWLIGSRRAQYIIFPLDGEVVAVYGSEPNPDGSFNDEPIPGFGRILNGLLGKVRNVNIPDPEMFSKYMPKGKKHHIGIYKPDDMTVDISNTIIYAVPDAEFLDITYQVDIARANRSDFEFELMKEAALFAQRVHEAIPGLLVRGRSYQEVMADVHYRGQELGASGESMIFLNEVYDNNGNRLHNKYLPLPGPVYKEGDIVGLLIETDGPGGFYSMTQRYYCLGEPGEDFKIRFKVADAANKLVGKMMKEGETLLHIAETVNQFIRDHGFYTDDCNYLHSMAYSSWEHPSKSDLSIAHPNIFESENLPLLPRMQALTHPHVGPIGGGVVNRHEMIRCGSSYYVGKEGGERTNNIPNDYCVL